MEKSAASKKKTPTSSSLSSRPQSRSNGGRGNAVVWSSRRPPERLDWPTIASSGVGVTTHNGATAVAAPLIRQEKLKAAAAAASTSSQESSPPKSKRQRRSVQHHWVSSSTQASTTLVSSQLSTSLSPPTRGVINSNYTINNNTSTNALWTEKYAPQEPSDLVVAPKKVEQVSSWIHNALHATSSQQQQQQQRLLVLVGSPGIGKSSMIHCLARQGGFNVLEWTESFMTRSQQHNPNNSNNNSGFMAVEQPSPINSFEAFLQQAAAGYSPLTMQTSSSSSSSQQQQQQHAASSSSLSQYQQSNKRAFSSLSQSHQRKMAPSSNNNNNNNNNSSSSSSSHINRNSGHISSSCSRSVILLDELPYCYDDEARLKLRNLLTNHIEFSILPCILIYSNVLEGKHNPEDLEALIDARVLYAPTLTTIVQIHAATKARLKKTLQHICQQEGIVVATATTAKQQQQDQQHYNLYQDLHFRSGGDVRFAITTLQYENSCNHLHNTNNNNNKNGTSLNAAQKKQKNVAQTATSSTTIESERDQKLSMFHALGKLLYAKRHEQSSSSVAISSNRNHQDSACCADGMYSHRAPLTFDPERVVEHSGIEVAGALSFLGYHSLDFYTDVEELSQAWDLFSDATYWLDRPTVDGSWYNRTSSSYTTTTTSYSAFPGGYASSLAGRAVAATNLHPAPQKFRQFSAPLVFEVMRKRRDNTSLIRHFQSRLDVLTATSTTSSHGVSGLSHCHPNEFAIDLAYVRMILPPEAASASQLQSHFQPVPALQRRQQEEQETATALLKEQELVLREDDIMDFDEDDDDSNNHSTDVFTTTNNVTVWPGGKPPGSENNKPSPTSSTEKLPVSSAMV